MNAVDLVVEVGLPAASLAVWATAYWAARLATRPRHVPPTAPAAELPGPESPALVSLLANRWRITTDAAESTLLDLAARGYLELRQAGPDPMGTTVHLVDGPTDRPGDELNGYERQVLHRVVERAVDGVLPLTALAMHDEQQSARWSKTFRRSVAAEARRLGLSRRRFPKKLVTGLTVVGGVAALGVGLGALHYLIRSGELANTDSDNTFGGLAVILVTASVLAGIAGRDHGERDTPDGRTVAARWLGLRAWLEGQQSFADAPPAAVTVWRRHLSYGAALGITRTASRIIHLGLADRERLWSAYGGRWRQVSVSYPSGLPRYGQSLGWIGFRAVLAGMVGGTLTSVLGSLWLGEGGWAYTGQESGLPSVASDEWWRLLTGDPIMVGFALAGIGALCYAGYLALRVVLDLAAPGSVTGEVLWHQVWQTRHSESAGRTRVPVNYYLAVDDGRADRTRAWVLPAEIADQCRLGDVITARVRPWTRRVRSVTVHRPARV
ncbi:DUF2207 family protein [Plantactinospora solaniradicis]|uniref:DUF2207 family protein n=2 Tax=Plantactinospora solaniradicis TaxID=1723736 RepID=A0ABW1KM60_9ACTN